MKNITKSTLLALAALLLAACSDDADAGVDGGPPGQDQGAARETGASPDKGKGSPEASAPDQKLSPDAPRPASVKVAAVQYGADDYQALTGSTCADDNCGVTYLVTEAAGKGAQIIVTPEYALDQKVYELAPQVGEAPASNTAKWGKDTVVHTFSKLADDLDVTLVFNFLAQEGSGAAAKLYNCNVAVGPDGKVLARHYKFQLFGSESTDLTPGTSLNTSTFDTPAGKAGLLICADVQCIITNYSVNSSCTQNGVTQLQDFFVNRQPRIVLFSSYWTVGGSWNPWGSLNVQQSLSQVKTTTYDGVYVVAANTTNGMGKGGSILAPGGKELAKVNSADPSVLYAEIPAEKK